MLLEHMNKKFDINRTKIKGGCQSGRKVVTHNSKSDLPLDTYTTGDKVKYSIMLSLVMQYIFYKSKFEK